MQFGTKPERTGRKTLLTYRGGRRASGCHSIEGKPPVCCPISRNVYAWRVRTRLVLEQPFLNVSLFCFPFLSGTVFYLKNPTPPGAAHATYS